MNGSFGGGFVAGSIVGKLLLDKSGWNQSIRAVDKDKQKLRGTVGQIGSAFMGLSRTLLKVGAGVGGTFLLMAKSTAKTGDEIAKLSRKVGISAEALSGYSHAAKLSGTSLQGFATGVRRLSANMVDSERGLMESVRAFSALGISVKDSGGKMKDLNGMLLEVADKFAQMEDGTVKAALAQDLFGRSGLEMIPMLNQGAEGLRRNREEAERLGIVFSDEAARAAEEFNDNLLRLQSSFKGLTQTIAIKALPILTEITGKLTNFMVSIRESISKHVEGITRSILGFFKLIVQAIEGVMLAFNALKFAAFKVGEETTRILIKYLTNLAIVTDLLATKFGLLKGVNEAVFNTMKDLIWIGREYYEQSDKSLETMADIVEVFEKLEKELQKAGSSLGGLAKKTSEFTPDLRDVRTELEEGILPAGREFNKLLKVVPTYLIRVRDFTGKVNRELEVARENFRKFAEVLETDATTAFVGFYNALQVGLNLLFMAKGGPRFPLFEKITDGILTIQDIWQNMNQQIEAAWIRGLSNIVMEFRNFSNALKQLFHSLAQIATDAAAMVVVNWIKEIKKMEEGTRNIIQKIINSLISLKTVIFFAAGYVGVKAFQALSDAISGSSKEIDVVMKKLNDLKARGEEVIATLKKAQLALLPPLEREPGSGTRFKEKPGETEVDLRNFPDALKAMIAFQNNPRALMRLGRIARASIGMMIRQGYTLFEALTALKEPLTMLKDKFLELGKSAPQAIQPMLDMIEKMQKRPKLFEGISGLLDVFNAFVKSGWMTQSLFKDLTAGAQGFVREILGVTGNLRKAIGDLDSISKEQIMMLAPIIAPFLQAAQQFGLKLPAWIADLAKKAGIKIEEQPIAKVPGLLEKVHERIGKQGTRLVNAIQGLGRRLEKAIGGIPSGQTGLDFYSGSQGGLVRYHPRERVSVSPASFNIQMQPTPIIVKVNEQTLFDIVARNSVRQGKYGHFKVHSRAVVGS